MNGNENHEADSRTTLDSKMFHYIIERYLTKTQIRELSDPFIRESSLFIYWLMIFIMCFADLTELIIAAIAGATSITVWLISSLCGQALNDT